jgi:multidrug efflux pump subunit AcrA (membrane-fusion protein)
MRWLSLRRGAISGLALSIAIAAPLATGCHRPANDATSTAPDAASPAADAAKPDKAASDDSAPIVSTGTARTGTIEKTLAVTGVLNAPRDREATLSVPIAGVIDALPVHLGQKVARGETILQLSTHGLDGQIAQARAVIAQNEIQVQQAQVSALQQQGQTRSGVLQAQSAASGAQATLLAAQATLTGNLAALTNAQQVLQRQQTLFGEGLVAQKDVESARLAVQSAEAQVKSQEQVIAGQRQVVQGQTQAVSAAQAARLQDEVKNKDIAIARQQLANARGALATLLAQRTLYTLRAPLGSEVTAINAANGEAVDNTTKLLTITNLDRLTLSIAIPTASAGVVHAGQTLRFKADSLPGRTFSATVREVLPQVDQASATITAVADIDNRGHLLRDNLSVRVELVTAQHRNAVLIPRAALLIDNGSAADAGGATTNASADSASGNGGGAASVLKLDKEMAVHKTAVTVGWMQGDLVELLSGVKAGETVVTTGAYGLDDGAKVQIAEADKGADKAAAKSDDKGGKD